MTAYDAGVPPPGLGRVLGRLAEVETPAVVVDSDVLDANLARMARVAAEARLDLRPHVKTHKSVDVARRQLALGAVGITAAKPSEAAVFHDTGFGDVFLAYPPVGDHRLRRLAPLVAARVATVGLDDRQVAARLGELASRLDRTVPVLFEVDVGMHRSGLRWGRAAADEAEAVARTPGVELVGVFTHEGHSHDHDPTDLGRLAAQVADRLVETAELVRRRGIACPTVSVGSTLTAAHMDASMGVTEIRPGVYAYADIRTRQGAAARWEDCALTVLTTVVSRPDPRTAIVDAGTKVLSPATAGPYGFGLVAELPTAKVTRLSEEHGTVELAEGTGAPAVGDRLHVLPVRAGVVVNTQRVTYLTRGAELLREVPVDAHLMSR